ncbi:polyprenyl synthetase family protein [Harryflintia acetispora]|uniref:Heptaprenyl diphosphate synthase n=1 Tax=Harryflintia acetispora TaxID=1849041 RepID=A0A9X8Y7H1_9FIRM|nr:polyprenyl synthetase family protein [Harryflintia acetispora]TCL42389.1 heptaprenyl diphosphate synthase [Harryflintia acetispora]
MTEQAFPDFEHALAGAQKRLNDALLGSPSLVREYTAHLAMSPGKQLRARCLLACAQQEDGRVPADAAPLAAGVELLHLATLVHDDVMDDAGLRRGAPTLQARYGKRVAVICGDWLLAAALRTAAALNDRERFLSLRLPGYIGRVCLGELRQTAENGNLGLTAPQYLRIIGGKTAALFAGSFYAGALLFTDEHELRQRYARFGRYLGLLFQLADDLGDFTLDQDLARKPVRSDYEQGVITLPLIHALAKDPELSARAREGRIPMDELAERVRAGGGLDFTRALCRRYHDRALRLLPALHAPKEKEARLLSLLERAGRAAQPF